ncbi:Rap1-interacting factor 1 N terminal-domain-containing protein [Terfezia claveryi]|nr:Rap1-interacting factor 1 N terminal-domain-containing protein [Terfezia claveryi]
MIQTGSSAAPAQSPESPTASLGKLSSKLLNRPPTPPRGSTKTASLLQESSTDSQEGVLKTPTSSADFTARNKKQVNWSPWTKYHKPDDPSPLRPSRPTSAVSTPLKSILKPFNPSVISIGLLNTSDQIKAYTYDSFPAMLESITQALASTERSKKLDTYVTFCNTLKAYDNNPDMKAIKNKMPLLSSFIRRDLGAKLPNSANNSGDSQLIQQAIKLLTVFVWLPELAESIDDDDATFFIQHAIQVLRDPLSPKVVVTYFLNFLVQQKFPPKIMTPERASGIIQALREIETRVAGNTVLTERIGIYHRLLSQAKAVMIVRTGDWMEHVLSAVLNNANNKDLRVRALHCMAEAARTIGLEKTVARSLTNLLNREDKDGVKFLERVTERLSLLIKNGEGVHVTQVWGLVILLLRGRHPVSSWEHFTPWLSIIQQCFNSSTLAIKVAANAAWSKLIYALHCGSEISPKDMDLLTRPLVRYLDPQYAASNAKGPRQAALSNVCAFLYYNIRPNTPIKQIYLAWDVIVVGLLEKLVLSGKHEVEDACHILAALFNGSHQKPWNDSRGLEKEAIKADEIMRLDPKWVRSNSATVLKTLETAMRKSSWEGESCAIRLLWHKFTKCLADASMKEIKISTETMDTVAHIFNMLQRFWKEGPTAFEEVPNKSSHKFVAIFTFLIITTFESIGTFCFTEKQLSYDDHNEFAAISTPSNRYSSGGSYGAVFHLPIVHLFQFFLKPFDGAELSEGYFISAKSILSKCLEAQDSRRKRLALLSACSTVLPQRGTSPIDRQAWSILANLTESALPVKEKSHSSPTPVNWEFKDILKIIQWGCRYDIPAWDPLFEAFAHTVQTEQGDIQLISTVIEPLAEFLRLEKLDTDIHTWLTHGKAVLEKAIYPKSQAPAAPAETTLKVPFGLGSRRIANTEPYDNLYNMINQFLVTSYPICGDVAIVVSLKDFIVVLIEFIHRCPKTSVLILLKRIQEGVAFWLADQKEFMNKKNSDLTAKMQSLWASIADSIRKLPRHDSMTLQSLATIISAGLESRRKVIVNAAIEAWNETFGAQNSLEYPARVRVVMKKLRPIADINLPNFPEDIDEIVPTPPAWEDSQESQEGLAVDPRPWSSPTPAPSRHGDRTASPIVNPISSSRDFLTRLREASLKATKPKARLKHLDSQLDFAPIAIDSQIPILDSQLLTDHQKDVRDRQQKEAAELFSDICVAQTSKPRRELLSVKEPTENLNVSEQTPPDRSPSIDEFVDAPEENTDDALKRNDDDYADEFEFAPATAFTIQVPKRVRLDKKPEKRVRAGPSNIESNGEQDVLNIEKREGLEVSSKYFAAPEGNRVSRKIKEPSVENNTQSEQHDNEEIVPVTERSTPKELEDTKKAANLGIIPDSLEIHRIPDTQSREIALKKDLAMSEREQKNSIVEVPDSFVEDSGEGADVRMTDSYECSDEEKAEKHTAAQVNTGDLQESLQLSEKRTKKGSEVKPGEMRTSKPGHSEKRRKGRPRKSLQIQTTRPKAEGLEGDDTILDCIMVTPRKGQAFPAETVLRKDSSPKLLAEGSSQDSPLNARKRKQRVSVEEAVDFELKPVDPPRKRRATRALKSTPVKPAVQTSIEPPGENFRQSYIPMPPPPITTPKRGKGHAKASTEEYPAVPRLRSSRRKTMDKEEVVLDSQPEVVATPSIALMGQKPEPSVSKRKVELDVSFITDSNAGASQAEEDLEEEKPESQEESKDPLMRFREAVAMLAEADLGPAELSEAADEVFEVYVRLRERRKRK